MHTKVREKIVEESVFEKKSE